MKAFSKLKDALGKGPFKPLSSVNLTRGNVYILPTRQGMICILLLFALFLISLNYNNNISLFFTFLLCSVVALSLHTTVHQLAGLKVDSARIAGSAYAGSPAEVELTVRTDSKPKQGVVVNFKGSVSRRFDFFPPQSTFKLKVPILPSKRGLLRTGPAVMASSYPFGLFRAWSRPNLEVKGIVFPRPARLDKPVEHYFSRVTRVSKDQGPEDYLGPRPYRDGDIMSRIEWRALARGQGLLVREFGGEIAGHIVFDFSFDQQMDLEEKISLFIALILESEQKRYAYGLAMPDCFFKPGQGRVHLQELLTHLSLFRS